MRRHPHTYSETTQQEVLRLYRAGLTYKEIAQAVGIDQRTITNIRQRHGEPLRGKRRDRGPAHPLWRGGVHYMHGYRKVWVADEDPLRCMANKRGWAIEHRLVMARYLGRPLTNNETVHHRNGVRDDNRLENLQLWLGNHGRGSTYRCADCGSTRLEAA